MLLVSIGGGMPWQQATLCGSHGSQRRRFTLCSSMSSPPAIVMQLFHASAASISSAIQPCYLEESAQLPWSKVSWTMLCLLAMQHMRFCSAFPCGLVLTDYYLQPRLR